LSRSIHRLSSAKVSSAKPKKLPDGTLRSAVYPDGGGLYLQVMPSKAGIAKSWIFRFTAAGGKERYMGLGPLDVIGLAEAREKAAECRKLRYEGIDPIEQRRSQRASIAVQQAKTMTFDQCAEAYMAAHLASWKHPGHAKQWKQSLANYVSPVFGSLPVQTIDVTFVMKVIDPIWSTKCETARRVRGRIEVILDWAATLLVLERMGYGDLTVHGLRSSFKDWAAECTDFQDWVSEKALAHQVGDETRRAYQRGDLLDNRRQLMEAWSEFCG
jgi:hypothetical protein